VVIREERDQMPEDNAWGFKLKVPVHKFNLGEIHNLSIQRGTLTDEERYIINDHIVQTIIMLEALPFPRHLRRVPEYAGGHHEKMDGTGYPRRLTKDQMSIPARIMAIADIFEALTAADRPYKAPKKLSESIKIMGFMVKDQHIDPDLFKLFLESGVYKQYAERFLLPDQIDEVDLKPYLGQAA
jgi:HD-GYP domain-containing protein (c-di-GMP phosphodiesterase class II)